MLKKKKKGRLYIWLTAMIEAKTPIKGTGDNLRGGCLSRTGVYLSDLHSVSLQRLPSTIRYSGREVR